MKLPTQAKSVDRSNRVAEAKAAGVQPAFFGTLLKGLKTALPIAADVVGRM